MCDEGRATYHSVNNPDRILGPLKLMDGRQIETNMNDALVSIQDCLMKILADSGPGVIGAIGSSSCTNEENYLLAEFVREVIGSRNVDVLPVGRGEGYSDHFLIQADKSPNSRGAEEIVGRGRGHGMKVQEMMTAARTGRLKALLVMGQDLMGRLSGASETREILGRLEFLVVLDSHENEMTKLAHYVLPKATFAEMDGTFTNCEGRVQRIRPALKHEHVWPGWNTLVVLAGKMGHEWGFASAEDVFAQMARNIPAYAGLTYEKIGLQGVKSER
jgi:predicted molibdopterin-dependent oxidoreductase YjgC